MQQEQLEDDLLIQAVNEVEQSEILSQHSVPSQQAESVEKVS